MVLNKAQEVDSDRLLKVYGALMWSIGRCLGGTGGSRAGGGAIAVPKVYVGSFWDGPRRHPDDRCAHVSVCVWCVCVCVFIEFERGPRRQAADQWIRHQSCNSGRGHVRTCPQHLL